MFNVVNPYPIDHEELYTFLESQAPDSVVGLSCDDGACPLARFLNAQYEGSTFYVSFTEYRRVMDDVSLGCEADAVLPLDEWAQDFVYLVDESAQFEEDTPVSALDALCFLAASCMAHGLLEVQYV
ncbi:MAG TPA: hypothetical protein VGM01_00550 [Ktedonobacteraceae bacterium]|jgi:hypothetical protein